MSAQLICRTACAWARGSAADGATCLELECPTARSYRKKPNPPLTDQQHVDAIRNFLAAADPATGYVEDDED